MYFLFEFNFLPDREVFKHAMTLLISEFDRVFSSTVMKYLKEQYLDPDVPEKLGGRAVGRQGMDGSTQGLERWGGHDKNAFYALVKGIPENVKQSPILFLQAVAIRLETRQTPLEQFCKNPRKTKENWIVIPKLARLSNKKDGTIFNDLQYLQCQQNGQVVDVRDVIGRGNQTYVVNIPTARNLYTLARILAMEGKFDLEFATFQELNSQSNQIDVNTTDFKFWASYVAKLSWTMKIELGKRVQDDFENFSIVPQLGETTSEYINRCGQRNPSDRKTDRIQYEKKTHKKKKTKKGTLLSLEEKKKIQDEKDKWKDQAYCDFIEEEDTIDLGEEPSLDEISGHLWELYGMDGKEKETMKMMKKTGIVTPPRQLGHYIKIKIDAEKRVVTCNCETCNFDARCFWVDTFEAMEFGIEPDPLHMEAGDATVGFQTMVSQAIDVIKMYNMRPILRGD